MGLRELLAVAYHKGAGVSLREVEKSASFQKKLSMYRSATERHAFNTHRGLVARFGGPFTAYLANLQESERDVLRTLRGLFDEQLGPGPDFAWSYAHLHELGERLLDAAEERFAPNIREMAASCKDGDARWQRGIIRGFDAEVTRQWYSDRQKPDRESSLPPGYEWLEDITEERSVDVFLPHRFDHVYDQGGRPSCLGMSISLAAFVRLAGLRFVHCHTIESAFQRRNKVLYEVYSQLYTHYRMSCYDRNNKFAKELRATIRRRARLAKRVQDWHHSVAVEISDGQWVHLDPYQDNTAVFDSDWHLEERARLLFKYREVAPTMVLQAHDHGVANNWVMGVFKRLHETLAMASSWRHSTAHADVKLSGELYAVAKKPVDYLARLMGSLRPPPKGTRKHAAENFLRYLLFLWWVPVGDQNLKEQALRLAHDREYREQRLAVVGHTFYYLFSRIVDKENEEERKKPRFVHPVLEIGCAETQLALSVLSNLRTSLPYWRDNAQVATLLCVLSNGQMYWHEAAASAGLEQLRRPSRNALDHFATMVSELPFVHDRTFIQLAKRNLRKEV